MSLHGSSQLGSRCDGRGWISVAGSASKQWNKFRFQYFSKFLALRNEDLRRVLEGEISGDSKKSASRAERRRAADAKGFGEGFAKGFEEQRRQQHSLINCMLAACDCDTRCLEDWVGNSSDKIDRGGRPSAAGSAGGASI